MFKPSFLYCRYAIRRLRLFQDLVRHNNRFSDIDIARPLEKLLPKGISEERKQMAIVQQINRLIPSVEDILFNAKINTHIVETTTEEEFNYDKVRTEHKKVEKEYDLIRHYFEIRRSYDSHRLLMEAFERGIGFYEDRQRGASFDIINPLIWIVWFIRLPLWILEHAGLKESHKIYGWFIRIMMVGILILVFTKLGISINWSDILKLIK